MVNLEVVTMLEALILHGYGATTICKINSDVAALAIKLMYFVNNGMNLFEGCNVSRNI